MIFSFLWKAESKGRRHVTMPYSRKRPRFVALGLTCFQLELFEFTMSLSIFTRILMLDATLGIARDGQYQDTCIGDTYRAILLYRYRHRFSYFWKYRVSASLNSWFFNGGDFRLYRGDCNNCWNRGAILLMRGAILELPTRNNILCNNLPKKALWMLFTCF